MSSSPTVLFQRTRTRRQRSPRASAPKPPAAKAAAAAAEAKQEAQTPGPPPPPLYTFGWNEAGAADPGGGDGDNAGGSAAAATFIAVPSRVSTVERMVAGGGILQIAAGPFHSILLDARGTVVVWGRGNRGQLGAGVMMDARGVATRPQIIPSLSVVRIRSVACGAFHSVAVDDKTGGLWTWGSNEKGQLGIGALPLSADEMQQPEPGRLDDPLVSGRGCRVRSVAAGFEFNMVLREDATCVAFGNGASGQLGLGWDTATGRGKSSAAPKIVGALRHTAIATIAVGDNHTLWLSRDGNVYAAGSGRFGRLGLAEEKEAGEQSNPRSATPRRVVFARRGGNDEDGSSGISAVYAGSSSSFAVSSSGSVFCWGSNGHGNLGVGHSEDVFLPTLVPAFSAVRDEGGDEGGDETGSEAGDAVDDADEDLDDDADEDANTASKTRDLSPQFDIRHIGVGSDHTIFLTWTGNVYASGLSVKGRLGLQPEVLAQLRGETGRDTTENPFLLELFPTLGVAVEQIAVGGAHSFAWGSAAVANGAAGPTGSERRGVPDASRSVASGPAGFGSAAEVVHGPLRSDTWYTFKVQIRDSFGKNVDQGGADLRVIISCRQIAVTVSARESNLDGWARGTEGGIELEVTDRRNGEYIVRYKTTASLIARGSMLPVASATPRRRQVARLQIDCRIGVAAIVNSPFAVQMEQPPEPKHALLFTAAGVGLAETTAGARASFVVEGRDALGELCQAAPRGQGKSAFDVVLKPLDMVGARAAPPESRGRVTWHAAEHRYHVNYTVRIAGTYLLCVSLADRRAREQAGGRADEQQEDDQLLVLVQGNPWTVVVRPAEIDPAQSSVRLPVPSEGLAPFGRYPLLINTFDRFGNRVPAFLEAAGLSVHVSGIAVASSGAGAVVPDAEADATGVYFFCPVAGGSGHILVTTQRGGRLAGTPLPVVVNELAGVQRRSAAAAVAQSCVAPVAVRGQQAVVAAGEAATVALCQDVHGDPSCHWARFTVDVAVRDASGNPISSTEDGDLCGVTFEQRTLGQLGGTQIDAVVVAVATADAAAADAAAADAAAADAATTTSTDNALRFSMMVRAADLCTSSAPVAGHDGAGVVIVRALIHGDVIPGSETRCRILSRAAWGWTCAGRLGFDVSVSPASLSTLGAGLRIDPSSELETVIDRGVLFLQDMQAQLKEGDMDGMWRVLVGMLRAWVHTVLRAAGTGQTVDSVSELMDSLLRGEGCNAVECVLLFKMVVDAARRKRVLSDACMCELRQGNGHSSVTCWARTGVAGAEMQVLVGVREAFQLLPDAVTAL